MGDSDGTTDTEGTTDTDGASADLSCATVPVDEWLPDGSTGTRMELQVYEDWDPRITQSDVNQDERLKLASASYGILEEEINAYGNPLGSVLWLIPDGLNRDITLTFTDRETEARNIELVIRVEPPYFTRMSLQEL